MQPYSELEYGGIVSKMNKLDPKFAVKKEVKAPKRGKK